MNNALFETSCVGSFVICHTIIICFQICPSLIFLMWPGCNSCFFTTKKFSRQCFYTDILHFKQKTCFGALVLTGLQGLVQILFWSGTTAQLLCYAHHLCSAVQRAACYVYIWLQLFAHSYFAGCASVSAYFSYLFTFIVETNILTEAIVNKLPVFFYKLCSFGENV